MPKKEIRIIKRNIDANQASTLSAEQQAILNALAAQPDDLIDYSDAEASPVSVQWYKAESSSLYRPAKQSTTVRLDADVLIWLKSKGRGYQTRINAILRQSMLQELKDKQG